MSKNKPIKVAILGASGYTGAELIRLISYHPNIDLVSLAAETSAGKKISEIYPHLAHLNLPKIVKLEEVKWNDIEAVFCCLPHGTSQEIIFHLPKHVKVIDLSADFRIYDAAEYEKWYGKPHIAMQMQKEVVYGLSEIYREQVKRARIVANPGCYPTSILLPLVPLIASGKISIDGIIADSKSGISGAGRSAKQENLFTEINDNIKPYGIAGHRHVAEIEQTLTFAASGPKVQITFTPQVIPVNRGILSNIYAKTVPGVGAEELKDILISQYEKERFVQVIEGSRAPTIRDVYATNNCHINLYADRIPGRIIIVSVIDNLMKGASGQAIQNFNIMFEFPEHQGIRHVPVFP